MEEKRVTILCGHYGSGKTNLAVNLAYGLREKHERVAVADLDIVNPYFRTRDSREELETADIRLICSPYAGSNVDIPALPGEIYALTDDSSQYAVLDIGGDDRGALVLGRLAPAILRENDYQMLLVVNCYRPLTRDATSTVEVMREIETAGGICFTGIVNNSNLGDVTSTSDVLASLAYADEVSRLTGLPVVGTSVAERLYEELKNRVPGLIPLKLQKKAYE